MKYVKVYDDWACVDVPDNSDIKKEEMYVIVKEVKCLMHPNGPETIEVCINTPLKGRIWHWVDIHMDMPMDVRVNDYFAVGDIGVLYIMKGGISNLMNIRWPKDEICDCV